MAGDYNVSDDDFFANLSETGLTTPGDIESSGTLLDATGTYNTSDDDFFKSLGTKSTVSPDTSVSVNQGVRENPDAYAKDLEPADRAGIPVEAYRTNQDQINTQQRVEDLNLQATSKTNPGVLKFLTDHTNSAVAWDDLNKLKDLENLLNPVVTEKTGAPISTMYDAAPIKPVKPFKKNDKVANILMKTINQTADTLTHATAFVNQAVDYTWNLLDATTFGLANRIIESDALTSKTGAAIGKYVNPTTYLDLLSKNVSEASGNLYQQWEEATPAAMEKKFAEEGLTLDLAGDFAYYATETFVASVPQMLAMLTPPGVAANVMALSHILAEDRAQNDGRAQSTFTDSVTMLPFAFASTALDKIGAKGLLDIIMDKKELGEKFGLGLVKYLGAKYLKGTGKEAGTEAFQEGVIEYLATHVGTDTGISVGEMLSQGLWAGSVGAFGGGAISSANVTADVLTSREMRKQSATTKQQFTIDSIIAGVNESKLKKRSGKKLEQFLNQVAGEQKIIIEAKGLSDYLTENEITDPVFNEFMGELNNAAALGNTVSMSVGTFAKSIVGTVHEAALRKFIKMSETEMTQNEISTHQASVQKMIEKVTAQAEADKVTYNEARVIVEGFQKQLINTGTVSRQDAKMQAEVIGARITRYAQEQGISVAESAERLNLTIKGPHQATQDRMATEGVLTQPAYKDAPAVFEAVKNDFLEVLPEDASSDEVMAVVDSMSPEQRNFMKALERDDWLGFDLPAQAISTALSEDLENFEVSPGLKQAIGRLVNKLYAEDTTYDQRATEPGSQQTGDGRGRTEGRGTAPLEGTPQIDGATGPDPEVVAVAQEYATANGIDFKAQAEYVEIDTEFSERVAQAYEDMAHAPNDPAVIEAFQNMIDQTSAQYDALVAAGYKFFFVDLNTQEGLDYVSSPFNAMRDLRENKRIGVFSTAEGFGTDDSFDPAENPLLSETEYQWSNGPDGELRPVYANDLFRAVHDVFGHGLEGAGFRDRGEENAWQAHARLYTGSAIGAVTSETRGQNSWLNYGPNGETNRTANVEDTVFADQKTGLMPEWTWTENRASDEAESVILNQDLLVEKRHQIPISYTVTTAATEKKKPRVIKALNKKNIEKQTEALNEIANEFPAPLESVENWIDFEQAMTGDTIVPPPPYRMIELFNDMPMWIANHAQMNKSQIDAAGKGFEVVDQFKSLYKDTKVDARTTGKLMLWGMLSRMLSTHPHESAFIDAAVTEELDGFIDLALESEWTPDDVKRYLAWAGSIIPDYAPGKQGTSNLNDFGKVFLKKMSTRMDDGRSALEHLHDMIVDPSIPTAEIRRRFYTLAGDVGIKNKVLSFVLLLTGRDDVVILDRIQINTFWDTGRYGKLMYDDVAPLFDGAQGLGRYEALERSIISKVDELYEGVGRPEDASVGRYHWESWVLNSGQVVAHPTIQSLVDQVTGKENPFADIGAPEGRYHQYAFGSIYAREEDGTPYIIYNNSKDESYRFGLKEFKDFLELIKKPATGVVPKKFGVKTFRELGYPWYESEEVNREKLDEIINEQGERFVSPTESTTDTDVTGQQSQILNQEVDAASQADETLRQEEEQVVRGQYDTANKVITLFEQSDRSTFIHEAGHFFLDVELKTTDSVHMETIKSWWYGNSESIAAEAGVSSEEAQMYIETGTTGNPDIDRKVYVASHEQFARAFEAYAMAGTAPSVSLRRAFKAFAKWLTGIYGTAKELNVNMSPEITEVFDRMLASEQEINLAQNEHYYQPMFTDAAMAGMTEEAFEIYLKKQEEAVDRAEESLFNKMMSVVRKQLTDTWKEELSVRSLVAFDELEKQPVHTARRVLVEKGGEVKIDRAAVKVLLGVEKLPMSLRGMTATGGAGLSIDDAAELFDFNSGDELISMLIKTPKSKKLAGEQAEAEMIKNNGDILNDGTIEKIAQEAVHDEVRGELILSEMNALRRNKSVPATDVKALRAAAVDAIGKLSLKDIRPDRYRKAEIRAAQDAITAINAGDLVVAREAKTRQAMNFYLYKAANDARTQSDKITKFMATFRKKAIRERLMRVGNGHLEQIDGILERFEFRKSVSVKKVAGDRANIQIWATERTEAGENIELSAEVLDSDYKFHYKEIPFSELMGIFDSVKNIDHVARFADKMRLAGEQLDFMAVKNRVLTHLAELPEKFNYDARYRREETVSKFFRQNIAKLTKVPYLVNWLDGGKMAGMMHELIAQPMTDAQNAELNLMDVVATPVLALINGRSKKTVARHARKHNIPGLVNTATKLKTLTGSEIISIALNVGNEGNLRKMLLGEGWATTEDEISLENPMLKSILQNMTKEDWDMVQSIWDSIDTLHPMMAAVHKESSGLDVGKVEAVMVGTPFGDYRGGYYPIKYDPYRSAKSAEHQEKNDEIVNSMFNSNGFVRPTANTGAKEDRTKYFAPISIGLDVVPNHIQEVVHYITHFDAVRQVNRLVSDPEVREAMGNRVGVHEYSLFKPWLNDIAKMGQASESKQFLEGTLRRMRFGLTLGAMGFKASTGIIQVLGLSTTFGMIGQKHTMKALRLVWSSPTQMSKLLEEATAKSKVLPHRLKTMDREMMNAFKELEGKRGKMVALQEASMKHIALIQMYSSDLPTWYAAYLKEQEMFLETVTEDDFESIDQMNNEADRRAVMAADFAVENFQGSGSIKDSAEIMRTKNEYVKMFTMFNTFFSALWNMQRDIIAGAKEGRYSVPEVAAKLAFMYFIPTAIEQIIRNGFPDEDDEPVEIFQKYMTSLVLFPAATIPMIRDAASGVLSSFGYSMTPTASLIERGLAGSVAVIKDPADANMYAWKSTSGMVGAYFGVPGVGQMWSSGEHIYDVIVEDGDASMRELLFGPKKD